MKQNFRHTAAWHLLRPFAKLSASVKFGYSCQTCSLKGPYIVVSNHVTDRDPLFIAGAFRKQMCFYADDRDMHRGLLSRLMIRYIHPADGEDALLRAVKDGCNAAMFPEGTRTWDGTTRSFPESTGALIRSSGAGLVTFRLTGGYFSAPRWAGGSVRRGRMKGEIIRVFTPQQLQAMSDEEINAAIAKDIRVDACAERRVHPFPYRGKALAEHIETFLNVCPCCGSYGRIESKGDVFRCKACEKSACYSPSGKFSQNGFPFDDIRSWSVWQNEQYISLIEKTPSGRPIFEDSGFELYSMEGTANGELLAHGSVALYRDRLDLPGDISIPLTDITEMSVYGTVQLTVSTVNGNRFFLDTAKICCTEKYLEACAALGCRIR